MPRNGRSGSLSAVTGGTVNETNRDSSSKSLRLYILPIPLTGVHAQALQLAAQVFRIQQEKNLQDVMSRRARYNLEDGAALV